MTQKNKFFIAILITLVLGFLLGWLVFSSSEKDEDQLVEQKSQIWTCSMHPQIQQSEPGDCPLCGMDLIPMDDDVDSTDPLVIRMSPAAIQLANVQTITVEKNKLTKRVRLNGKVQPDERLISSQASHLSGRIEQLLVDFTGEFVTKGQTIARIYSPELVSAQEELFEAEKIRESQPELFQSVKEKLKNWKLSEKQIEEILDQGAPKETFAIKADVTGYVTERLVKSGDYVKRGEHLYQIADLSNVWVMFDVYESDIPWVAKGAQIEFNVASVPGESFTGKINYIDPVINPKSRVAKARVEVQNKNNQLKPEMFASGETESSIRQDNDQISVPKSAVLWTGKRSVVYVKQTMESGTGFKMREVLLGPSLGKYFVIQEGLEEGEEIVVNGTFSVDAAAQLAGKPSMMKQEGDKAHKDSERIKLSEEGKNAIKQLFDIYFELSDKLAEDKEQEALAAAKQMKTHLDAIDMSIFLGDAHEAFMSYHDQLQEALLHVHHIDDIEKLRELFEPLSMIMVELTQVFPAQQDTLYKQYCPMAFDDQGAYWLSRQKEIYNPYFGASMLRCGEVKQVIE